VIYGSAEGVPHQAAVLCTKGLFKFLELAVMHANDSAGWPLVYNFKARDSAQVLRQRHVAASARVFYGSSFVQGNSHVALTCHSSSLLPVRQNLYCHQ
jgi:hypothetical protein